MSQFTSTDIKSLYSEHVKTLQTYIMFRIKQKMVDLTPSLEAKERAPLNLSMGAPMQPPPQVVIDALKKAMDEPKISMYSTSKGEAYFLEAVASRMKHRFGVDVDPKTQVCGLIGSKEGLANLFRAFITPKLEEKEKDIIMVPDPGYASYQEAIRTLGGYAYPIALKPEDNYLPDPEKVLEQLKKDGFDPKKVKMFVLNYPSNPIGATAPLEYYQKVIDFGLKHNILICSDAAYADMQFGKERAPSILQAKGAMDIAVECHSLSKPYSMTGWRIGFAVGNTDAVGILAKVKSTTDTGIFKAVQRAGMVALTDPSCDEYIKNNNEALQHKQKLMVKGFQKLGWPIEMETVPKATFYLWLPVPDKYKSDEDFTNDILETSGIVAVPGTGFGKYGKGYFRLSLVLPDEQLLEMIDRLEKDGFRYK
jgi:LL-diaminopimelate aminotransferase